MPPHVAPTPEQDALIDALRSIAEPLARLAVAKGVTHQMLDEVVKQALVAAAHAAHPELPPHRRVSRISAATGIHRREVTRITRAPERAKPPRASLASGVYAHWLTDPAYQDASGQPLALPRSGAAPSFDALARRVTNDVHPRTLLGEMARLGFASHDAATDLVRALPDALVPRGDAGRMMKVLGANIGDHLQATVANVLGNERQYFDQAIVANELSEQTVEAVRALVRREWKGLFERIVPAIERLIAEDAADPERTLDHRLRIGLYGFDARDETTHPDIDAQEEKPE